MKDILTILTEAEIEIPEDKKATINKAVLENYKTVADYNNVVAKRDGYKESLDDVQGKLEAFKDVDVEELQGQISTLKDDLQAEKDARTADIKKAELEKSVETFLSDKQFINTITATSIKDKLTEELDKDTAKGKSIEDLFKGLVTDADGNQIENILVTEADKNKAKFTDRKTGGAGGAGAITKTDFLAMSLDERTELKKSDPELYQSLRK